MTVKTQKKKRKGENARPSGLVVSNYHQIRYRATPLLLYSISRFAIFIAKRRFTTKPPTVSKTMKTKLRSILQKDSFSSKHNRRAKASGSFAPAGITEKRRRYRPSTFL